MTPAHSCEISTLYCSCERSYEFSKKISKKRNAAHKMFILSSPVAKIFDVLLSIYSHVMKEAQGYEIKKRTLKSAQ